VTLAFWLGSLAALGWLAAGVLYLETRVLTRHRAEAMRMLRAINGAWAELCELVRWAEAHRQASGIDPDADIVIADADRTERVH
jgi:hypothetical protein